MQASGAPGVLNQPVGDYAGLEGRRLVDDAGFG